MKRIVNNEDTIIDEIERAASRSAFVLVDCEGVQSLLVGYAISYSDLVLILMQASQLDAPTAASMVHMVKTQEKVSRRSIPFVLMLTRTRPAITTGSQTHIKRLNAIADQRGWVLGEVLEHALAALEEGYAHRTFADAK